MDIRDELERRVWAALLDPDADGDWDIDAVEEAHDDGEPLREEWVRALGSEEWPVIAEGTGLEPWLLSRAFLAGHGWEV